MARRGEDLDDIAVLETVAQRDDLAVDTRTDALVPDLGVDGVGEINGRCVAWEGLDRAFGREAVDLLRVEVDLERVQELVGVLDLLLPLEQLPQPGKGLVVLVRTGAPFLVLPVRGDALLRDAVHLVSADLDLEGLALVADDGGVQRLIAVGPRHGDEVFDATRHWTPEIVEHAEHGVAVWHRRYEDAEGDEVIDLLQLDALPPELQVERVEPLDAAVHLGVDARGREALQDRGFDLVDEHLRLLVTILDARRQVAVVVGLEVLEGEIL